MRGLEDGGLRRWEAEKMRGLEVGKMRGWKDWKMGGDGRWNWDPSSSDRAGLQASHKDTKLRRDKMPWLKMR